MTPRDRLRALAARLWPPRTRSPRARGRGEDLRATQRGEARRQAGRVALRPRCAPLYGAPSSRPSRRAAEARTARGARAAGGRRAGEPAAREGAWPRRAQARSRGQALWSLGAARGGASPREHTQAVVSRRRSPLRGAAEWTGREPSSSRPTAWCRAALEPRRSARTPSGRRPSQPPARGLNRTSSGPLARLRTARAAGCGGGRSAGLGESAAMRNAVGADLRTVAGRRSAGGFRIYSNCLPKRGLQNTSGMHAHALASA